MILGSRKPEAKEFRRWVTKEVLPAIRKNGGYIQNLSRLDMARMILEAEERNERHVQKIKTQSAKIAEDAPKVEYYDTFQEAAGSFAISDVAKVMGYSRQAFFDLLAARKVLFRRGGKWMPYQDHVSKGHFAVKVGATEEVAWKQARITPKGKTYLASIIPVGPLLPAKDPTDIFSL